MQNVVKDSERFEHYFDAVNERRQPQRQRQIINEMEQLFECETDGNQ